jgi:cytochrome c oxidase subunit 2
VSVLGALLLYSTARTAGLELGLANPPLVVAVTGRLWWWELSYRDPASGRSVQSANELRIPVGRPVQLGLRSDDVIHSLWVPELGGKMDLVPGRTNRLVITATRPGLYRGQCAEFCGLQHAKMRLRLHADAPADFENWRQQQLQAGREPSTDAERRGRSVFTSASCVLCHSVQGTDASATIGPDLTHVASRDMIAAGTLPNTPANLAAWIAAPHRLKPGVQMPATPLPPDDLGALTQYLASLR